MMTTILGHASEASEQFITLRRIPALGFFTAKSVHLMFKIVDPWMRTHFSFSLEVHDKSLN